jgi:hypothetical protein
MVARGAPKAKPKRGERKPHVNPNPAHRPPRNLVSQTFSISSFRSAANKGPLWLRYLIYGTQLDMPTPRRAALYARVSTKDKGQDTQNQLAQLRDFCRF